MLIRGKKIYSLLVKSGVGIYKGETVKTMLIGGVKNRRAYSLEGHVGHGSLECQ